MIRHRGKGDPSVWASEEVSNYKNWSPALETEPRLSQQIIDSNIWCNVLKERRDFISGTNSLYTRLSSLVTLGRIGDGGVPGMNAVIRVPEGPCSYAPVTTRDPSFWERQCEVGVRALAPASASVWIWHFPSLDMSTGQGAWLQDVDFLVRKVGVRIVLISRGNC